MTSNQARNAYRQSEAHANIHPVKLIHLMYERVLSLIDLTIEGIRENSPLKRGENLGKVISIITELNASIKETDDSEAARFLRGLYNSMLIELPKVAISNDIKVLEQTSVYIKRLMEIWEQTAMKENGLLEPKQAGDQTGKKIEEIAKQQIIRPTKDENDSDAKQAQFLVNHGLSVSI